MVGMAQIGAPISLDGWQSIRIAGASVCVAPENPEDGEMYLLVLAHPGCPDKVQRAVKWLCVCDGRRLS